MDSEKLRKLLQNRCSKEEIEQIYLWAKENDDKKTIDLLVEQGWYEIPVNNKSSSYQQIWQQIERKISLAPGSKKRVIVPEFSYLAKLAATFIIIAVVSGYLLVHLFSNSGSNTVLPVPTISKSTGWGEKLTIRLPDKSMVYLNSGTKIEYPETFSDTLRTVKISGEAYFEVVKDNRSFEVNISGVKLTVLGTAFNVNDRDQGVSVALVEGKLKVDDSNIKNSVFLNPGEQVITDDRQMIKSRYNAATIAWRQNTLIFNQEPFENILKQLEQWYGVHIETGPGINLQETVSGTFSNENLENILGGIGFSLNFTAEINNKDVLLQLKKHAEK